MSNTGNWMIDGDNGSDPASPKYIEPDYTYCKYCGETLTSFEEEEFENMCTDCHMERYPEEYETEETEE